MAHSSVRLLTNNVFTQRQLGFLPGIWHLGRVQEKLVLHHPAHSSYNGQGFHPVEGEKNKNLCQNETLVVGVSLQWCLRLTRSSTRENSGVLRVFRGSAGLRVSCSSVSGGTCLMKKYLQKNMYKNAQTNKIKWKWHTAKYGNPYLEFVLCIYPYKVHTHSSEHTPGAVGSHLCCGARGAVGGSVPYSRAPQLWYWGWRGRWSFTPPTYNSCRPETRTRNLLLTSPTLTIRPWLPQETTLTIIHDGTYLLKLT